MYIYFLLLVYNILLYICILNYNDILKNASKQFIFRNNCRIF